MLVETANKSIERRYVKDIYRSIIDCNNIFNKTRLIFIEFSRRYYLWISIETGSRTSQPIKHTDVNKKKQSRSLSLAPLHPLSLSLPLCESKHPPPLRERVQCPHSPPLRVCEEEELPPPHGGAPLPPEWGVADPADAEAHPLHGVHPTHEGVPAHLDTEVRQGEPPRGNGEDRIVVVAETLPDTVNRFGPLFGVFEVLLLYRFDRLLEVGNKFVGSVFLRISVTICVVRNRIIDLTLLALLHRRN